MYPAVVLAVVLCLTAADARADMVILNPIRDNTLFEDADGDTSNGAGPGVFAGQNNQDRSRRAVMAFGIAAALPGNVTIDSVTLTLVVSSAPDAVPHEVTLHRLLADWGEGQSYSEGGGGSAATPGDATWLHKFYPDQLWTTPGGDFSPETAATAMVGDLGTYVWRGAGMTADVQAWHDQPSIDFGWLLQGDEAAVRTVRRFDSREAVTPETRPKLTIYYSATTAVTPTTWGAIKKQYR